LFLRLLSTRCVFVLNSPALDANKETVQRVSAGESF